MGGVGTEVNCDETFLADASSFIGGDFVLAKVAEIKRK